MTASASDGEGGDIIARTSSGMPVRIVTAAAIFDGHDAAINIMRRIFQSMGAEVIHLGHDRSAEAVARAAIEEDVHAIAITSYQGGAVEFFTATKQILDAEGFEHVVLLGGGGGTILPQEIRHLRDEGIARIYSPDDGRVLGLTGMVEDALKLATQLDLVSQERIDALNGPIYPRQRGSIASLMTIAENLENEIFHEVLERSRSRPTDEKVPVIGFTGTGGSGKSSTLDELMLRIQRDNPGLKVALLCTDPSRKRTGGALLGDRIRMNSLSSEHIFMRSFASRGSGNEIAGCMERAIEVCQAVGFDLIFAETSGIGQGDDAVRSIADLSVYVLTNEYGAPSQLEKLEMLDADLVVLNKFEKVGAEDALAAIRKQVRRNRKMWGLDENELPVVPTIASQFNDEGINMLWFRLATIINDVHQLDLSFSGPNLNSKGLPSRRSHIPFEHQSYLQDVATNVRKHHFQTDLFVEKVNLVDHLEDSANHMLGKGKEEIASELFEQAKEIRGEIPENIWVEIGEFKEKMKSYREGSAMYQVRGKNIQVGTNVSSLSGLNIPRVALPSIEENGILLKHIRSENLPGHYPYTAGVFPFKRKDELPVRQFAGEGSSERTNERFHFLSKDVPFNRLSTAFDSPSLYGADPNERLDIYGKVGESGVSISTIEEMELLYDGFDLCASDTSVSMTINGNYWWHLACFFHTAAKQQLKKFVKEHGRDPTSEEAEMIEKRAISIVRGTVQADQLKEAMGQNTLVFSLDFALRMMGDVAEWYAEHDVRNHYFVSISGYHIAEAGANPITQAALTLANAFTYVEIFRARGMDVDEFLQNFSFFFSNGMDIEYSVIGRVCRRIWAIAMREQYCANNKSQKLKYHIQSSGRSLHAQEFAWNDYRTTMQALYAIQDSANSLHTNSRDEAFGTPTEDTVRDAVAIQLILSNEYGWNMCENPLQGSFIVEWLTNRVEEEVLQIFEEMNRRGGVLGSLETGFQRTRIQEESMEYEHRKDNGSLPIAGVNYFVDQNAVVLSADTADTFSVDVTRSNDEEKKLIISRNRDFRERHAENSKEELANLRRIAIEGGNLFAAIYRAAPVCTVGQVSEILFEVGGAFRRDM